MRLLSSFPCDYLTTSAARARQVRASPSSAARLSTFQARFQFSGVRWSRT